VDLLTDPQLLTRAREEFQKKTAGKQYQSAIPAGQKPPVP
jgi:hypothetical protein